MKRALLVGIGVLLAGCNGRRATASAPPAESSGPAPSAAPPAPASSSRAATAASAPGPTRRDASPPEPQAPEGMLLVPAGPFTMGADDVGEQDERPAHTVTLPGFFLDKTEVPNAKYLECVEAKVCRPYRREPSTKTKGAWFHGKRQPVVGVSWKDAKDYCTWRGKRLPTEAEFEKAARGLNGQTYPWGEDPPDPKRHGRFARGLGARDGVTADVGSYPEGAGPYGHLDLAGNVWEWVDDLYDPMAYRRDTADRGVPASCDEILKTQDQLRKDGRQGFTGTNPIPKECERVLRGGAFNYPPKGLRASNRVHHPGGWRLVMAGFRCARDL